MKCPVCERELTIPDDGKLRCIRCGFDDIRTEFINDEERIFWQTYVVKPCKYAYRLNYTLQMDVMSYRNDIKKLTSCTKTIPVMLEGWNYDDALAHPNSAVCANNVHLTNVIVYDIKCKTTPSRTTITFVAQRTLDSPEKKNNDNVNNSRTVGFCWRVKNENGIIVHTGEWEKDNLMIGDAILGKIDFDNFPKGCSIDFVDKN